MAHADLRTRRFLLGTLLLLGVASALLLAPFLSGIVFALAAGYLLQRPFRFLARRLPWRPLAAGLLVLLVVLAVCLPLVFVAWQLVQEAEGIVGSAQDYNATLQKGLASLGVPPGATQHLVEQGAAGARAFAQQAALGILAKLPRFLANVGIFVFLLFFVLLAGESLGERLRRSVPLPPERRDRLLTSVGLRVRALFLGTFLVAVVQGGFATLGWWLLGYPNPLFWGALMTLLAVIPAIGPMIILVPAAVVALVQGRTFAGWALLAYGVAVVSLVDNVVRAVVVGRNARVHPALVLLGTVGGLLLFGVTGFLIGPLVLSMVAPILDELEATAS